MRLCGILVLVVTVCSCRESRRRIMLRKAENERLKSVRRRKVALKHKATRERVNASAQYVHARARTCRCYVCAWLWLCVRVCRCLCRACVCVHISARGLYCVRLWLCVIESAPKHLHQSSGRTATTVSLRAVRTLTKSRSAAERGWRSWRLTRRVGSRRIRLMRCAWVLALHALPVSLTGPCRR